MQVRAFERYIPLTYTWMGTICEPPYIKKYLKLQLQTRRISVTCVKVTCVKVTYFVNVHRVQRSPELEIKYFPVLSILNSIFITELVNPGVIYINICNIPVSDRSCSHLFNGYWYAKSSGSNQRRGSLKIVQCIQRFKKIISEQMSQIIR